MWKKNGLAFSKFDAGGPENLIINFAWPNEYGQVKAVPFPNILRYCL